MGRTNGAKTAADYFGGLRKAPSSDQAQSSGLRRFFGFLAPSNNRSNSRSSAEAPSARASASFLLPWRSTRGPADVLAVDQGAPSFDALQVDNRWESVATDVVTAARESPPSREDFDSDETDDNEDEERLEARARMQQRRSMGQRRSLGGQRQSMGHPREVDYHPERQPPAQPLARQEPKQETSPLQRPPPKLEYSAPFSREREPADQAEQVQALRQLQVARLQDLQRQATLREREAEEQRPQRLEYQPWEAPSRPSLGSKVMTQPHPPLQHQQQPMPPRLEYSVSHRHLDFTPHPPPASQLQSQSAKFLHSHAHAANPSQDNYARSADTSSRQLLRLPPCTQQQQPPPLVLRDRATTIPQMADGPLSGPGSRSRRFADVSAAASADEEARGRGTGAASRDWDDGDEERELALLGLPSRPRGSFDRAGGGSTTPTRSIRRGVFSDAGGDARATTPNRLAAGPWQASYEQGGSAAPASPAAAALATAAAPPPPLRRDSSIRFSVASLGTTAASNAPSTTTAAGTSFSTASAAAVDNASPSPSRRVSHSGHDSMVRRTALLREACNGANSMRAKLQGIRTSQSGTGSGQGSVFRHALAGDGSGSSGGALGEELEPLSERSQSGQMRETSVHPSGPSSVASGTSTRVSNPGVWTTTTALSVRVRHDLGNRAAAEEAGFLTSASLAGAAPRSGVPRWQEMLHAASAALDGGLSSSMEVQLTAGWPTAGPRSSDVWPVGAENSEPQASFADADSGSSRSNSVAHPPPPPPSGVAPPLLQRADTCRDRVARAVTPAARTGRVLQRANTQPAKLHSRFSIDGDPYDVEDQEDSMLAGVVAPRAPVPMPPATAVTPASPGPVAGSPRAGRRMNGATIAPVPPPPRSGVSAPGLPPPSRRISEASGSQQLVLPVPPPPVPVGAGGAPSVGASVGATASPRVTALAERVRERSGAGAPSPPLPPLLPSGAAPDSPPQLATTPSFGRRTQFLDPPSGASASPRRLPRASSPLGNAAARAGGAGALAVGPPGGAVSSPLPPPMPSCRSPLMRNAGGGGGAQGSAVGGGPYDVILDALRTGPLAAADGPGAQRKGSEGEAGLPASLSSMSVPLEPVRVSGSGITGVPRPRRLADMRAAAVVGTAGAGGSWPLPPLL